MIKTNWIKFKNRKITFKKNTDGIYVENNTSTHGYLISPKIRKYKQNTIKISFKGKSIDGNSATLCLLDSGRNLISEITLNGTSLINVVPNKKYLLAIKIHKLSKVQISNISIDLNVDEDNFVSKFATSDTLVITPSYPSLENKYFGAFVHSRLSEYKKAGINFDVVCAFSYNETTKYEFEGVNVLKTNFATLRKLLQLKKYKRILVHFFDEKYAQVLDCVDLSDTQLFLWVHGPETLYWDWPMFMTGYFQEKYKINECEKLKFQANDKLIKKYNNKDNVTWVFVSNWIKQRSEELIGIKFKQFKVIPNIIDEKTFNFVEKDPEQRKKVFFLRRFDNIDKYAIDVNIRTILELSKRECFKDMEFNIYGTGDFYDALIDPIRNFPNVHLYTKFLSHEEIAKIHKENGIALFATRYDAQGVSMCEAASSGMVVVSSQNDAIKEFIPNDVGILAPTEEYKVYADIIERLYNNPDEFLKLSKLCHEKVNKLCSSKQTVGKEIEMFSKPAKNEKKWNIEQVSKPILSIIIPSYNVAQYLKGLVYSLVNQKNANKLEILIVNDGSKDNTVKVAKEIINKYCNNKKPIITLIDKENGGHGSTINVGIRKAKGKYIRIIDGDDWVDSLEFENYLNKLENEKADIVLTDYSEDLPNIYSIIPRKLYTFMNVGQIYDIDILCNQFYGFREWGPILATGTFKREVLLKTNFKLSEKSFYVDMEFDIFSIMDAQTVVYYNNNIYRYYIGRAGQSVSYDSFIRNRKQHEKVLFRMIDICNNSDLSNEKKDYINRLLITPMIKSHYIIVAEYMKSLREFNYFEKQLKKFSSYYYNADVSTRFIRFHRKTKGTFLWANKYLKYINSKLRK